MQETRRLIKRQRHSVMKIYPDIFIFAFLCLEEEMNFDDFSQDSHICFIKYILVKTSLLSLFYYVKTLR